MDLRNKSPMIVSDEYGVFETQNSSTKGYIIDHEDLPEDIQNLFTYRYIANEPGKIILDSRNRQLRLVVDNSGKITKIQDVIVHGGAGVNFSTYTISEDGTEYKIVLEPESRWSTWKHNIERMPRDIRELFGYKVFIKRMYHPATVDLRGFI